MKGREIKIRWNVDFLENNIDLFFGINNISIKNKIYNLIWFFKCYFFSVCIGNYLIEIIRGVLIYFDVKKYIVGFKCIFYFIFLY